MQRQVIGRVVAGEYIHYSSTTSENHTTSMSNARHTRLDVVMQHLHRATACLHNLEEIICSSFGPLGGCWLTLFQRSGDSATLAEPLTPGDNQQPRSGQTLGD